MISLHDYTISNDAPQPTLGMTLLNSFSFQQGPAISYIDSFAAEEKSTYAELTESLLQPFSPTAEREQFYFQFDAQTRRPGEDPALFLRRLKELSERAEPDLSDSVKDACSAVNL